LTKTSLATKGTKAQNEYRDFNEVSHSVVLLCLMTLIEKNV
jgi:hypothetical protein